MKRRLGLLAMKQRLCVLGITVGVALIALVPPAQSGTASCLGKPATITGTSGNDTLAGTSGNDVIAAKGGNDDIEAKDGDDRICGSGGNDEIDAGSGEDQVSGGGGVDTINTVDGETDVVNGGKGTDTCKSDSSDTVKSCASSAPECSDGNDNDSDGKTDYPNDPGCGNANDDSETPDPTTADLQAFSNNFGRSSSTGEYTYGGDVVNNGPAQAQNIVMTITVPANFTVTSKPSWCSQLASTLTCTPTAPNFGVGGAARALIVGYFTSTVDGTFTTAVSGTPTDPDPSNNTASTTITGPTPPQCANGTDDDTDGATDHPADQQCSAKADDSEAT